MLQHINPCVKCTGLGGQAVYAISRAEVLDTFNEKVLMKNIIYITA